MTAADDREVTPGPCGDRAPLYGDGPPLFCDLRSGHAGWHEGGEHRTSWTYHAQPTPDARDALAAAEARGVERGRTEALAATGQLVPAGAEVVDKWSVEWTEYPGTEDEYVITTSDYDSVEEARRRLEPRVDGDGNVIPGRLMHYNVITTVREVSDVD